MPEPKLKPCPFCGMEGVIKFDDTPCYHGSTGWYFVQCAKCGAESGYKNEESEAIKAWNKRVTEAQND